MNNKQKQHLLAYLGYYTGEINGELSKHFEESTRRFQTEYGGLDVDGICGSKTEKAMKHAVAYGMPTKNVSGDFWDDIKYFERAEFKCKCGGKYCDGYPAEPDERMVRIADQLRKNLRVPVTIISGLRCKAWNAIQGGVPNSQHMYGEAADVYASGVPQSRVEAELDKIGGVRYHYAIKNSNNVHFDVPKGNR